jgi:hypothetical protein
MLAPPRRGAGRLTLELIEGAQTAGDFLQSAKRQIDTRKSTSEIRGFRLLLAELERFHP